MNHEALLPIINKVLEKKGMEPVDHLSGEQSLRDDFQFDSLDLAELTVRIEDKFGVDVFANGVVRTISEIMAQLT